MKVEIYSDIVCPWCYIGERRFARALAAFPGGDEIDVVFRPFQLDPAAPETAVPHMEYLAKRFGGRPVDGMLLRVTEAAAGEGITMDWDRAIAVNTHTAHRLLRLAEREYGTAVQRALVEKLFDAHFSQGGNVADHAQLTELAVSVGMDAERVRAYLESDEGAGELGAELDAARQLGVQAVPTFVFDGQYVVEGGHPASVFLRVLEEVERRAASSASESDQSDTIDDACVDGSCAVGAKEA
ncbi:MAG TPA: DsbA family oxidoreductase [Gemmatimonadaceae bacterium]|nr:DsbA family oxidoreductase [Gemmatimonadaceae bacterium]